MIDGGRLLLGLAGFSGLATILGAVLPVPAKAAEPISAEEAHAIGVEAYLYFYPLVTMDLTRRQLTNGGPPALPIQGPMNEFRSLPAYPSADMKVVVRPNFDTLYSSAWLDLSKEPMIVSVPDTHGRYYLLPMLDMWTDVFASPGWRTTGTGGRFSGRAARLDRARSRGRRARSMRRHRTCGSSAEPRPTGRPTTMPSTRSRRATSHAALRNGARRRAGRGQDRSRRRYEDAAEIQVDSMPAGKYFAYAAEILKLQPPHLTDQPIVARMKRIGLEPGKSFDLDKAIRP